MNKTFTLLLLTFTLFVSGVDAGTPTIDGVYSAAEGWGTAVATGDGTVGWADGNAKTLYVTYDDNYVYFGAECSAQSWQTFIVVVNTKAGGDRTDPWGRTITYNQTEAPDFLFRGDLTGSNYAEYQWYSTDSAKWFGLGTNINVAGTEVKGVFAASPGDGFVELRVPRSYFGTAKVADIEFIVNGNSSGTATGHGIFDAIPNETNGTGWDAPANATIATSYIENIPIGSIPVIDGIYSPGEGWGAPVATGDSLVGWADANAKALYITSDDNYVYFGASLAAQSWQQFIIVVNTKDGGDRTDPWGRTITYNQTDAPDFLFRGDLTGSNYAEYQYYNTDSAKWLGLGVNINAAGTEVKGIFAASPGDGFIELRVPRSYFGSATIADVELIVGGNSSGTATGHGIFDAIPNETNGTSWDAPGNATIATKYISDFPIGEPVPVKFAGFSGILQNNEVKLSWATANEENVSKFIVEQSVNGMEWISKGTINSSGNPLGDLYHYSLTGTLSAVQYYRIRIVDTDGSISYSNTILIRSNAKAPKLSVIENPVRQNVRIAVNMNEPAMINGLLLSSNGQLVRKTAYRHAGGNSTMDIKTTGLTPGMYVLRLSTLLHSQSFRVLIK